MHRYHYALRRLPASFANDDFKSQFEQLKVNLLLNLTRCCRKKGLSAEAVAHASTVLKMSPDCLDALKTRANALKDMGKFTEAAQDLNEALKYSPGNRELHKSLMKVMEEMRSFNNNDQQMMPISVIDDKLKFVDDSASEVESNCQLK